jgi:hypothetical protein
MAQQHARRLARTAEVAARQGLSALMITVRNLEERS